MKKTLEELLSTATIEGFHRCNYCMRNIAVPAWVAVLGSCIGIVFCALVFGMQWNFMNGAIISFVLLATIFPIGVVVYSKKHLDALYKEIKLMSYEDASIVFTYNYVEYIHGMSKNLLSKGVIEHEL